MPDNTSFHYNKIALSYGKTDDGIKSTGGEQHHFTITLQDATIAGARAMTEDKGPIFGQPSAPGMARHEATHAIQQRGLPPQPGTSAHQEEVAVVFEAIKWGLGPGVPPDIALKTRAGQTVKVQQNGRTVLEGKLKAVQKASPAGDAWKVILTGARRG